MRTFGACGGKGGANAPRAPPPGYGPAQYYTKRKKSAVLTIFMEKPDIPVGK